MSITNNSKQISKISSAWANSMNPLRGLTQSGINSLIEQIKRGCDVKLQVAFKEIETNTPIFGICINKRLAGIIDRKWDILPIDGSDEAKTQAETVKQMFLKSDMRNTDGLTNAIRHLGMAAFRGRAVVKPFINDNNELYFKNIENWNALEYNDKLYWNPSADQNIDLRNNTTLKQISDDEVVWIKEERPIDIPGLQVYLRQLVGEDGWAKATEKYGVAQVIITAPDGTPDQNLDVWNLKARQIFEGGSGVLPSNSKVDVLTDARGQDPFSLYIEHQMEMIVLLACGEKLTTLGGSTGLGSNLADIQSREFQNLVSYDCKLISNSITRCAVRKCVNVMFPKQEVKCKFSFIEEDRTTPEKYLELASKLKDMGVTIDIQKLKEITGLSFISDEQSSVWQPKKFEVSDERGN